MGSLGGSGTQQAMADAVNAATGAGVTVVVAGGNSNGNSCNFSPAFVPSAITVGSTTSTLARSSFSNYGVCTDIWAPGTDILSAGVSSDTATATFSGTSKACPHVSGGAALLLERNPTWNYAEVLEKLLADARINSITDLQRGDTNAELYVGSDAPPPPGVITPPPTPAPTPAPPTPPATSCTELPCEYQCEPEGCTYTFACIDDKLCDDNTPECTFRPTPFCDSGAGVCADFEQMLKLAEDIEPGCYHRYVCCVNGCGGNGDECFGSCFNQSCFASGAAGASAARALLTWPRPSKHAHEIESFPSSQGF